MFPIERRADWLVLATRLVLLRARLMFPGSPAAAEAAARDATTELQRLDDLQFARAAGAWLQARPQLGWRCSHGRVAGRTRVLPPTWR